jgi:hypothetical protein
MRPLICPATFAGGAVRLYAEEVGQVCIEELLSGSAGVDKAVVNGMEVFVPVFVAPDELFPPPPPPPPQPTDKKAQKYIKICV